MNKSFKQISKEITVDQNIRFGLSRKQQKTELGAPQEMKTAEITVCLGTRGSQNYRSKLGEHNSCHLSDPADLTQIINESESIFYYLILKYLKVLLSTRENCN